MARKLALKRETLRDLDDSKLGRVAGGETGTGPTPVIASAEKRCLHTEQTGCVPSYYCTPAI